RRNGASIRLPPIGGAHLDSVLSQQRRVNAKNRVSLLFCEMRHGPHEVAGQLAPDFFGQVPDLLIERSVTELQIMVSDQILDLSHLERHSNGNTDGAHWQQLNDPVHPYRTVWSDPFQRRQPHHLGAIKKQVAWTAFAGIDNELRHGLSQQLAHGLTSHLVSHIESININHFAGVSLDLRQGDFAFEKFGLFHRRDHEGKYLNRKRKSK